MLRDAESASFSPAHWEILFASCRSWRHLPEPLRSIFSRAASSPSWRRRVSESDHWSMPRSADYSSLPQTIDQNRKVSSNAMRRFIHGSQAVIKVSFGASMRSPGGEPRSFRSVPQAPWATRRITISAVCAAGPPGRHSLRSSSVTKLLPGPMNIGPSSHFHAARYWPSLPGAVPGKKIGRLKIFSLSLDGGARRGVAR